MRYRVVPIAAVCIRRRCIQERSRDVSDLIAVHLNEGRYPWHDYMPSTPGRLEGEWAVIDTERRE